MASGTQHILSPGFTITATNCPSHLAFLSTPTHFGKAIISTTPPPMDDRSHSTLNETSIALFYGYFKHPENAVFVAFESVIDGSSRLSRTPLTVVDRLHGSSPPRLQAHPKLADRFKSYDKDHSNPWFMTEIKEGHVIEEVIRRSLPRDCLLCARKISTFATLPRLVPVSVKSLVRPPSWRFGQTLALSPCPNTL
ncbi:hypothetical protein I350_00967 [Cryptococcus amylolentus CBS 6273]|uniref:Uncharacterized protein n=1 Tax=Cryptococcus amylolentus CBS 6273 TaxID=1296118 RepID=A0A1E3KDK7_9TREE|nr:hypothetical protein I350_00967 [Cryptococcus amylolentus CBS 6273]